MTDRDHGETSQPSGRAPGHEEHRRVRPVVRYREGPGEPYLTFSPARRVRPACGCWRTYSYPDRVVLSLISDSRRQGNDMDTSLGQIHELRETVRAQARHIRELEAEVREERQRTDAERESHHDTRGRLIRVLQRVQEHTGRVAHACSRMVEQVLDEAQGEGENIVHEQAAPPGAEGEWEEEPEMDPNGDASSLGSRDS